MAGRDIDAVTALLDANGGTDGYATMVSVSGFVLGAKVQLQAWQAKLNYKNQPYTLDYKNQTADFTVGQVVTGGTSGATGTITNDVDGGATGTLTLVGITGIFQDNELLTDPLGGSADADGTQAQAGAFTVGQVVTGGTSGATGTIASIVDSGATGYLLLTTVTGIFQNNEALTDPITGTADADGTQTLSVTQTAHGKIVDIIVATKKLGIRLETDWDDKLHGPGYGQSTLVAFLKAEHATVYQSEQLVYGDATPTP